MFRFTIRDVLWLMVVVAMGATWIADRRLAEQEKQAVLMERDAAVANEHRIAELKAREMAGALISQPGPRARTNEREWHRAPISP
jgi:hypothetical protein